MIKSLFSKHFVLKFILTKSKLYVDGRRLYFI